MKNRQDRKTGSSFNVYFICLLFTVYCLLFTSCGRRGDPVIVKPADESAAEKKYDETQSTGEGIDVILEEREKNGQDAIQATEPGVPTGLTGLYTQSGVILTWDEVEGLNIRYRIYRSAGDSYILAGETVTPAFTDKDVRPNKKYHYRVTAVGVTEGLPSSELLIVTETQ